MAGRHLGGCRHSGVVRFPVIWQLQARGRIAGAISEQRLAVGGGNTRAPARRPGGRTGLERRLDLTWSFRMSKHDLQARPICHHQRDSIEAHLTIVFAALAVSRWTEDRTGWSIRKFVKTARRYRTIEIQAGDHVITAADPLPHDLQEALDRIQRDTTTD